MKLEASAKTSEKIKKPHIRKGYYPAKLVSVEPYKDEQGNLKECKYGKMLIFNFAVYKEDPDTGAPTVPMKAKVESEERATKEVEVELSKFVYHIYKDKKSGQDQTAITPNSAITKILQAMGWKFSADGVDLDELIGRWVEVNVDDYEHGKPGEETYTASSVKDVNPYKGPKVEESKEEKPKEKEEPKKEVKEEVVEGEPEKAEEPSKKEIEEKMKSLEEMYKDNLISESGYKQAIEQLKAQLK